MMFNWKGDVHIKTKEIIKLSWINSKSQSNRDKIVFEENIKLEHKINSNCNDRGTIHSENKKENSNR